MPFKDVVFPIISALSLIFKFHLDITVQKGILCTKRRAAVPPERNRFDMAAMQFYKAETWDVMQYFFSEFNDHRFTV